MKYYYYNNQWPSFLSTSVVLNLRSVTGNSKKLCCTFRTKMLISPHSSVRGLPEDCKPDHFNLDSSPKRGIDIPKPCFNGNHDNRYNMKHRTPGSREALTSRNRVV